MILISDTANSALYIGRTFEGLYTSSLDGKHLAKIYNYPYLQHIEVYNDIVYLIKNNSRVYGFNTKLSNIKLLWTTWSWQSRIFDIKVVQLPGKNTKIKY